MLCKTSELTGAALDWAVAKCVGWKRELCYLNTEYPNYSENWSLAGPIIEREGIEVKEGNPLYFPKGNEKGEYYEPLWIAGKQHGPTPLVAAMRCYVASKLGEEVEVPDELITK